MSKSHIGKHISKVLWETLSRARHVDEKLAWDGKESEVGRVEEENEYIFFTPPQIHVRENVGFNVVSSTQNHLEVNCVIHSIVVEELRNL